MSKSKSHNSIIFLTTLSVYLGLVLVGATPQVLAQVKPITGKSNSKKFQNEPRKFSNEPLDDFKNKIRGLIRTGKLDLSKPFEFKFIADIVDEKAVNPKFELILGEPLIDELQKQLFQALISSGMLTNFSLGKEIAFNGKNDGKTFLTNISVKMENSSSAHSFADALSMFIPIAKDQSKSDSEKVLLENTKLTSENNQVFIVTRLPRAAIDSLLK